MRCDMDVSDDAYRRRADREISDSLDGLATDLFVDHVPFVRNFLCKWPGPDSALYLHRDWMYVDEERDGHSYVVWVPLVDVTLENGPLQVLPFSHRVDRSLRGTHLNSEWVADDDLVRPLLVDVEAACGQAVVFDNALVHCSPANSTDEPRIVAAIGFRRRGAVIVHHRRIDDRTAARYHLDEDFLVTADPSALAACAPEMAPAEVVDLDVEQPTRAEVARLLSRRRGGASGRPPRRPSRREHG